MHIALFFKLALLKGMTDMLGDDTTVTPKKCTHLCLREPYRLVLKVYIYLD